MIDHATPMEFIWSAIAFVALFISLWCWQDAEKDSAVLTAAKVNGLRRITADNSIRIGRLLFATCIVMSFSSLTFLVLEPPPPAYRDLPQSLIGIYAWIFVAALIAGASMSDAYARRKVQKYAPVEVQTASTTVETSADGKNADVIAKTAHDVREQAAFDATAQVRRVGDK
jgi:hypothetical protein